MPLRPRPVGGAGSSSSHDGIPPPRRRRPSSMIHLSSEPRLLQLPDDLESDPEEREEKAWKKDKELVEMMVEQMQKENEKARDEIERWKTYSKRLEGELQVLVGPNWQERLQVNKASRPASGGGGAQQDIIGTRSRMLPHGHAIAARDDDVFPATRRQSLLLGSGNRTSSFDFTTGTAIEDASSLAYSATIGGRDETKPRIYQTASRPDSAARQIVLAATTTSVHDHHHDIHERRQAASPPPSSESVPCSASRTLSPFPPERQDDIVSSANPSIGPAAQPRATYMLSTPARTTKPGVIDQSFWTPGGGVGDEASFVTALSDLSDTSIRTVRSPTKPTSASEVEQFNELQSGGHHINDDPEGPSARRIEAMLGGGVASTPAAAAAAAPGRPFTQFGESGETGAGSTSAPAERVTPTSLRREQRSTKCTTEDSEQSMSSTGHLVLNAPADPAKLAALLAQSLLPQIEQIVIQADRSLPPLRGPELKRQDPSVEETLTHAIDEMREFLLHLDSEAIEREQRIVGMLMQAQQQLAQ